MGDRSIESAVEEAASLSQAERTSFLSSLPVEVRIVVEAVLADVLEPDAEAETMRVSDPAPQTGSVVPRITGTTIGSYEVTSVLGRGGMGAVYIARQRNPDREVALKVIRSGVASPRVRRRFEFEARILGRLQHPGIAQIFEAGIHEDESGAAPYFAMELIRGSRLTRYADDHDLSHRERLELFARICDAVEHAHQKGVIHRDLKPANILVTNEGQPKVLDFGVARATDMDVQVTTLHTDTGQLLGTVPYMSPEQISGDASALDTRSDVYSLGVVLFELLTHRLPYDVSRRVIPEAARIIREEEPTRLSTLDTRLRGDIETIVGKSLEKERDRRYGSAAEMARDIRRYLGDEPIAARPPSAMYQVTKFAKRNKTLVGGISATALVLIAGIVATSIAAVEATKARDAAQRRFDDVRHLAHVFIFEFDEMIRDVPGTLPARRRLVETAQQYLDGLASEASDEPDLLRELAVAYLRVGDVQGQPNNPNLGDADGALRNYDRAREITEQLVAQYPDNTSYVTTLRNSLQSSASIYKIQERWDEGEAAHQRAVALAESVSAADPGLGARFELAATYSRMGEFIFDREEDLTSARAWYERGKVLLDDIIAVAPDDRLYRRNHAVAMANIAKVMAYDDENDEALPRYLAALAVHQSLLEEVPNKIEYLRDVAVTCDAIGEIYDRLGRARDALAQYERSLEIRQRLAEVDHQNVQAQRDLGVSYYWLTTGYESLGRDETRAADDRLIDLRTAHKWGTRCVGVFESMRDRGILRQGDADALLIFQEQIAEIGKEIRKAEGEGEKEG